MYITSYIIIWIIVILKYRYLQFLLILQMLIKNLYLKYKLLFMFIKLCNIVNLMYYMNSRPTNMATKVPDCVDWQKTIAYWYKYRQLFGGEGGHLWTKCSENYLPENLPWYFGSEYRLWLESRYSRRVGYKDVYVLHNWLHAILSDKSIFTSLVRSIHLTQT